jgi:hypothetical protein
MEKQSVAPVADRTHAEETPIQLPKIAPANKFYTITTACLFTAEVSYQ